jgi:AhpD family alkylhydroperoxidase
VARISPISGYSDFGPEGFAGIYQQRPELWQAFRFHYGVLWEYSTLDAMTKDLMRIKSAFLNGCKMCQVSRASVAIAEGMDEDIVAKVHNFRESDLPERLKLALEFAERWILDRAYSIDDALIEALKEHYTEPQIVEIAIAMGSFEMYHKFNNAFDVDAPVEVFETQRPTVPDAMRQHLELLGVR